MNELQEQEEFLKKIIEIFTRSSVTYRHYLDRGKTYRYAQELKSINGNALDLLIHYRARLGPDIQNAIESLIKHYAAWSLQWEKLDAEKEFRPDEQFIFANDVRFPREAARYLETLYEQLG